LVLAQLGCDLRDGVVKLAVIAKDMVRQPAPGVKGRFKRIDKSFGSAHAPKLPWRRTS
jgi:hypothetical protein